MSFRDSVTSPTNIQGSEARLRADPGAPRSQAQHKIYRLRKRAPAQPTTVLDWKIDGKSYLQLVSQCLRRLDLNAAIRTVEAVANHKFTSAYEEYRIWYV